MSVVLSEHLPLLASAPDGIQKLRGLILELAVRGKLVPQNPNDEPASELLNRIVLERARLEAQGGGKKSKPLLPVAENEQPFDGPDIWEFVRLGSVLEMVNGRAFKPGDWRPAGIPIVRIQNLNNPTAPYNYCDAETLDGRHRLVSGDFLISWSGTPGTSFGAFIWNRGEAALNQHIFRCVQIGAGFTSAFLRLAINSQLNVLIAKAQGGVGLQHVTKGTLEALVLPLPPLAEQHRIVAKVDELMALCDRLEAEQADAASAHARLVETLLGTLTQSTDATELAANWQRLAEHFDTLFPTEASIDALKQTVLQLAVMGKLVPQDPEDEPANELLKRIEHERARLEADGICKKSKSMPSVDEDERPFEVPEGWEWERIGNYVIQTDYGLSEKTLSMTEGVPVLKMGDIQAGKVILGGQKVVALVTEGLPYLFLDPGDLLYNRTNSAELVGKTGIFRGLAQQYSFASYLIRIRCFNELVSPTFLNFVMNSPMFRETEIVPHLKQQCGQANVNGAILRNMRIPVPPAAEQHRIVAKLEELMALCDRLKADLVEARARQARLADTLIDTALEVA